MQNLPFLEEDMTTHYAPFRYAEPVRGMILKLKYTGNGLVAKALAPYLAAIYLRFIQAEGKTYTLIPVPLHKSRQHERGYNQSLVLAKVVAEYLNFPVLDGVLIRTRKTIIQKHMDAATRAQNMRGAFTVLPERAAEIKNKNILLIDDVYTTGSTTGACRQALHDAGATEIKILTVASVSF